MDRLPLAIELTAARTRAFSAAQLADLIHTQFGLVSSASSTRPARQQTLDAAGEAAAGEAERAGAGSSIEDVVARAARSPTGAR